MNISAEKIKQLIYLKKPEVESGTIAFDVELTEFVRLKLDGYNIYEDSTSNDEMRIFGEFSCNARITMASDSYRIAAHRGSFEFKWDQDKECEIEGSFSCHIHIKNY